MKSQQKANGEHIRKMRNRVRRPDRKLHEKPQLAKHGLKKV